MNAPTTHADWTSVDVLDLTDDDMIRHAAARGTVMLAAGPVCTLVRWKGKRHRTSGTRRAGDARVTLATGPTLTVLTTDVAACLFPPAPPVEMVLGA